MELPKATLEAVAGACRLQLSAGIAAVFKQSHWSLGALVLEQLPPSLTRLLYIPSSNAPPAPSQVMMDTCGGHIRHGAEVTAIRFAPGVFYSLYDYVLAENSNLVDDPQ